MNRQNISPVANSIIEYWSYFIQDHASMKIESINIFKEKILKYEEDNISLCFLQLYFICGLHHVILPSNKETDGALSEMFQCYAFEPHIITQFFYFLVNKYYEHENQKFKIENSISVPIENILENRYYDMNNEIFSKFFPIEENSVDIDNDRNVLENTRKSIFLSTSLVQNTIRSYKATQTKTSSGYLPLEKRSKQINTLAFASDCILQGDLRNELFLSIFDISQKC